MAEFGMIFHNHQPVGNFENVMERAVKTSYKPFIEVLKEFPSIHLTLHFSGPLLTYLKDNHKSLIEDIALLLEEGRVEILTSGFGEPILTAIPERDRVNQILKMNSLIEEVFDYLPVGAWVTERVFDPELVGAYVKAGVKYIILDDCHFLKDGIDINENGGPYTMVTSNGTIKIFKSDSRLRDSMPFDSVENVISWLNKYRLNNEGLIVMGDDGEKFGEWPGMFDYVYGNNPKDGWLYNFFTELENISDNLRTITMRTMLKDEGKKVYIPAGSYHEMNSWAGFNIDLNLKTKLNKIDYKKLQPANWFNFLYRYSESATLFGKMQLISKEISLIPDVHFRKKGEDELFNAQCNCAYWHGVFGGIYLPHLRMKIMEHLISARKIINYYFKEFLNEILKEEPEYSSKKHLDWLRSKKYIDEYEENDLLDLIYTVPKNEIVENNIVTPSPSLIEYDFDFDGKIEYMLRGKNIELIIDSYEGGTIFSIDYMDKNFDFGSVMTRRIESYHSDYMGKVENLEGEFPLIYDPFRRSSFRDHFVNDIDLINLDELSYCEYGTFLNDNFSIEEMKKDKIIMKNNGFVLDNEVQKTLEMKKSINLNGKKINVDYLMSFNGKIDNLKFMPEMNFMFMSPEGDRYIEYDGNRYSLGKKAKFSGKKDIIFWDNYLKLGIKIKLSDIGEFYYIPVYTISRNFDKFEAIYQGFSLYSVFGIVKDEKISVEVELIGE